MQEKRMKQAVYMVTGKNEQGFTLISVLIIGTVLFTTLPLLVYTAKAVTYESTYDEASIQQFYQFLRDELIIATGYTVSEKQLILHMPDDRKVSFMRYQQQILRQVNGSGHDIYLRDIEEIVFEDLSYGFKVNIISLEGKKYEKEIVFYMGT